jgi:hypothetical protein
MNSRAEGGRRDCSTAKEARERPSEKVTGKWRLRLQTERVTKMQKTCQNDCSSDAPCASLLCSSLKFKACLAMSFGTSIFIDVMFENEVHRLQPSRHLRTP